MAATTTTSEILERQKAQHHPPTEQIDRNRLEQIATIFQVQIEEIPTDKDRECCFSAVRQACQERNWELITRAKALLAGFTDVHRRCVYSAFVQEQDVDAIRGIVSNDLVPALRAPAYRSSLHDGARSGNLPLIRELWRTEQIDGLDERGLTPLFVAIVAGHPHVVNALLSNGAQLIPCGYQGHSLPPLFFAAILGERECVDLLAPRTPQFEELSVEQIGNLVHVLILHDQGAMLRHLRTNFTPQFEIMCRSQHPANGRSPLHFAAIQGAVTLLWELYDFGLSLDAQDQNGDTPLHLAALENHRVAIEYLVFWGARLGIRNHQNRAPEDLPEIDEATRALLVNLRRQREVHQQTKKPDYSYQPPTILVFKGGGPRGPAYLGVAQVLEEKGFPQHVRRVAGTSAGGIQATLMAIGCQAADQEACLEAVHLPDLLDHGKEPGFLKNAISTVRRPITEFDELQKARGFFAKLAKIPSLVKSGLEAYFLLRQFYSMLSTSQGICEGRVFLEKIEEIIAQYTGIAQCTFGELAAEIKRGNSAFKHLHVYAIRMGKEPQLVCFSSEDPQWQDLIIAHAIRATVSIPIVFRPHTLHFKGNNGRVFPREDLGHYIDGGIYLNLALNDFDYRTDSQTGFANRQKLFPQYNKQALGFNFYTSKTEDPEPGRVESLPGLICGLIRVYYQAGEAIYRYSHREDPRVIHIDDMGVGLLDFDLNDQRRNELVQSGRRCTELALGELTIPTHAQFIIPPDATVAFRHVQLPAPPPTLIEREAVMTQLESKLLGRTCREATSLAVVCGVGGSGKTTLAINFGMKHPHHFSLRYMIHAETQESYEDSYYALATLLKLGIPSGTPLETLIRRVHSKLENHSFDHPWLLIFDNVEREIPMPSCGGSVLMTCRDSSPWDQTCLIQVGEFTPAEATDFLTQSAKISEQDSERVIAYATAFPLALATVAPSIAYSGLTLIPDDPQEVGTTGDPNQRHPMDPIWDQSLHMLEQENPEALSLLRICAHLNPDGIPTRWLKLWGEQRLSETSEQLNSLIHRLCFLSLLHYDRVKQEYTIHRLLQNRARTDHDILPLLELTERMYQDYDGRRPETWPAGRAWLRQVNRIELPESPSLQTQEKYALLCHRMARIYLTIYGNDAQELAFEKRACAIWEALPNPPHNLLAEAYDWIGEIFLRSKNGEQALEFFRKGQQNRVQGTSEEASSSPIWLHNCGRVHLAKGDVDQALPLLHKALGLSLSTRDNGKAAGIYIDLGNVFREQNKSKQAIRYFREAHRIYEANKEIFEDSRAAILLSNLGCVLYEAGWPEVALRYLLQAQAILKRLYHGLDHPSLAITYHMVGCAYCSKREYEESIRYLQKSVEMAKASLGENHPTTQLHLASLRTTRNYRNRDQCVVQ